jgi:hypothetical protein
MDNRTIIVVRLQELGWTFKDLANKAGVHDRTVSDAINGRGHQRPATWARLLDAVDRRKGDDRRSEARGPDRRVPKVECPYCSEWGSRVIDSRPSNDGGGVRRLRRCLNAECRRTYRTIETIDPPRKSA